MTVQVYSTLQCFEKKDVRIDRRPATIRCLLANKKKANNKLLASSIWLITEFFFQIMRNSDVFISFSYLPSMWGASSAVNACRGYGGRAMSSVYRCRRRSSESFGS